MNLKKKLNLSFIILIVLILLPIGFSVFGLYNINFYYSANEKLNKLSTTFYNEYLILDKYSKILSTEDIDVANKDERLADIEKIFLSDQNEAIELMKYLKQRELSEEENHIYNNLFLKHEFFDDIFNRIKESFINIKTKNEKTSLSINLINQKRDILIQEIFNVNSQNASSTDNFSFTALSKYNKIINLESIFLYENTKKESLNTLLFSLNDLETYIEKSHLFDSKSNVFLLFKDYRDKLDLFYSDNSFKVDDNYSLDSETSKLDKQLSILLNGDSNNALFRLKEIQYKKYKDSILFSAIALFFCFLFVFVLLFSTFKRILLKIINPFLNLINYSKKIIKGEQNEILKIKSFDEIGELTGDLNKINSKLQLSQKNLAEKENDLKFKVKIEALVQTLSDGIIMFDLNKNILLKNNSINKIFNLSNNDKFSLKNIYSTFLKYNLEFHVDLSLKTAKTYKIDEIDLLGLKFEVIISGISGSDNKPIAGLMVFHEKQKSTKDKYTDSKEIDFGPIISSHFGTPLSYISLFTDMLSSGKIGELNKEQKDCIVNIHQSAINMKKVINKLHDISIVNNDDLEIYTENIEIATYLKDIIKGYSLSNGINNVDFNFKELLPEGTKVNIDKKIFSKIFKNLLNNSIVYSKNINPFIVIELKELGFNYLISIKDNGIGIPSEDQDSIFNKFFRGKNSFTKNTSGAGLNLYLAKNLLNKTGVELFFESKEGEGTTFFIEIPKGGMRK